MGTLVGPLTKSEVYRNNPWFPTARSGTLDRTWYRTTPRRSIPTPYFTLKTWIKYRYQYWDAWEDPRTNWAGDEIQRQAETMSNSLRTIASNKSYSKFMDKMKSSSAWMVNALEMHSTVKMIVGAAQKLLAAWRALRKGDFGSFAKILGIRNKSKKKWQKPSKASATWLEYHFGWVPLLEDIHSAIDTLQGDFPPYEVMGTGMALQNDPSLNRYRKYRFRHQAKLKGINPNLYLANSLGLINPAAIAWELVPFSFVVDWFIPVGSFLNSYTDLVGIDYYDSFTTETRFFMTMDRVENAVWMTRSLGVANPIANRKVFKGFSVTRGATAIALLIQQFGRR